jgi:hypothetical protein
MIGAAVVAWLSGMARDSLGDYRAAFLAGGALAIVGGLMALRIDRTAQLAPEAGVAPA